MKLHRLTLSNYRGVAHRDIQFPEQGVVVVCGANEIGKSSMIEALDLLLEFKDRSTKKEVKQVKPTNADAGSEVTAEISTGPYRFLYRKRFHKKCETALTVLAPRREQLTGDEAHERVRAMLAETVDAELWRAQRVLQAASTAAVDLSCCDALSRALDIAAGDNATLSGTEPLLIERIDGEYARYFTATGRPTGEWAAAINRLTAAEKAVAECAAAVAEVDDRIGRHADLTQQVASLSQQLREATPRLAAAQAAAAHIDALNKQLHEAKLIAAAAAATSATSQTAMSTREALRTEIHAGATTLAAVEQEAQQAAAELATARTEAQACEAAVEQAERRLTVAQQCAESARRILDQVAARDEAGRLSTRLARIDEIQRRREEVDAELSANSLTDDLLRRIEDAAAAVDRTGCQLQLLSAVVEFTAEADLELAVGDDCVSVPAGQTWSAPATGPTEVRIPGILTARITPGATALDIQTEHVAAQEQLQRVLMAAAVANLPAARSLNQRRRELTSTRDQLAATLAGVCGDEQVGQLKAKLAQLQAAHSTESITTDAATARAELDAAETARKAAQTNCETTRHSAAAASQRLAETTTKSTVLQNTVLTQRTAVEAAKARLAQEQAALSDEELARKADAELQAVQHAERRVAELTAALNAREPQAITAELTEATKVAQALGDRHDAAVRALREVSIELSVIGSEGRKGKLDAAETEREHALSHHASVGRRAHAAQLLRTVMGRHRDTTRQRYVEPYRAELQRLGRPVFGPTFEIDVDSDLRICSRTIDNVTVPYESLSGGAKEQLGILARLACAALVAKEDTVPVLVDDALGFTDPDRLAKMGEVFDTIAAHGQVIVLTCSPSRYDGVKGAQRIDLTS
ncbi:hypothetical protein MKUB_48600 [Mycobacterium kubicae]|uniref:AAA family ATPase n=1 Tax=Mycobacterium kubicae TaxID=120959 RepID=A0AAX1J5I5_9MYCO|nr:AAA family ATPase [Mycobacterium kubicae]MCV7094813.1 AAA family ATPase [Mycobacterium kubicae]ORV97762.1 hypothetical protein AWC13_16230 [Mycobacterium kubicae]QNI13143.1 AAA family ATPase [Mycobacterium kubicae]QPI36658.1 AAA family ATPase [Mycobacterium kubicae]GFG67370.1 hypothetical protein MKUB_48600 [Mycobacterium kubicae]